MNLDLRAFMNLDVRAFMNLDVRTSSWRISVVLTSNGNEYIYLIKWFYSKEILISINKIDYVKYTCPLGFRII